MLAILRCRNGAERGRLLDLNSRLIPAVRGAAVCYAVALGIAMPSIGVLTVIPAVVVLGVIWLLQARLDRFFRPEMLVFFSMMLLQLAIGAGIALAHGPRIYYLSALILPCAMASVVLPHRAAMLATALSALIMAGVAIGFASHAVIHTPLALIFPEVYLVIIVMSSSLIGETDVAIRASAVVDKLTGLLNRVALEPRIAELEHQVDASSSRVALLIADVDSFKAVNDEHGHECGDAVLAEVAEHIRRHVPALETPFRLSGDEFLVVLPGADATAAIRIAETICASVIAEPIAGIPVTMSIGVSATEEGEPFAFASLFGRADTALYRAKREGRGCVRVSEPGAAGGHAPAPSNGDEPRYISSAVWAEEPELADRDVDSTAAGSWWSRLAELHAETGSRLIRDDLQREHLLRLNRHFRERNARQFGLAGLTGIALASQYGWITTIPPFAGMVVYLAIEHSLDKFRRPEYWLGAGWLVIQNSLLVAAVLVNRPAEFALIMAVGLIVTSAATFPRPAVAVGVVWTLVGTIAAALVMDASFVLHNPAVLTLVLALEVSVGLVGLAVGRSTLDYRKAVVVDRLTGTFTRSALEARIAELTHQSSSAGDQVAVVAADLDWFKSVNDRFGHAVGDAVLAEVGARVRSAIRTFDSAYRVGGEEFVLLLPGVGIEQAAEVAERVRDAVCRGLAAGVAMTMSLGVAVSEREGAFDYQSTFSRADAALYRAKQSGRDLVVCDGDERPRATRSDRDDGESFRSAITAA